MLRGVFEKVRGPLGQRGPLGAAVGFYTTREIHWVTRGPLGAAVGFREDEQGFGGQGAVGV